MKFSKIYVELTNRCNLQCSFCSQSNRPYRDLSLEEFAHILKEISPYTKNIYLHVKGEPLLYPRLDEVLTLCDVHNIKVSITSNGTLLDKKVAILKHHPCLKQLNLSLHCENNKKNYLESIFASVEQIPEQVTIIYRFWALPSGKLDTKNLHLFQTLLHWYHQSEDICQEFQRTKNVKLTSHIYIDREQRFVWPSEGNNQTKRGYCLGGKTHLGILSDGSVVPCCLDGEGEIILGNLLQTSLCDILQSERYQKLIKSFQEQKGVEPLCLRCEYRNRFQD